jgi:methylmalonyl-CoA mutase cobalamin-binding subunit
MCAHRLSEIFRLLAERKDSVVAGGVMPDEDVLAIKQMGVRELTAAETPPPGSWRHLPPVSSETVKGRR